LDFTDDSLLVVLSGSQLHRFTVTGTWQGVATSSDHRLSVMSITSGCGDRQFAYGVPSGQSETELVPWVHELGPPPGDSSVPLLYVPGGVGGNLRFGALIGFDGTEDGVFVWHMQLQSGVEAGYWIPCDGTNPRVIDSVNAGESVSEAFVAGADRVMVLTLPDTLFAGAAAQGRLAIRAFRWKDAGTEVTTIHAIQEQGCGAIELLGGWNVHDLEQGLIVLARDTPFPAVYIVDWAWIEARLVDAACAG
jgi:hypothetical protein